MVDHLPDRQHAARLDPIVYRTPSHVVHVIACTYNRERHFAQPWLARLVAEKLTLAAHEWQSDLYCYCVMPDHVHTVVTPGRTGSGDLRRIIGSWKAAVSREALQAREGASLRAPIWQRGFWDHVLRQEDDVRTTCECVLENPVRRDLVDNWEDWPYSWLSPEV
jgi:REP element-mobilizing transposase RayT